MWLEVGDWYLKREMERDQRIKDLVEFPADIPDHYPNDGTQKLLKLVDTVDSGLSELFGRSQKTKVHNNRSQLYCSRGLIQSSFSPAPFPRPSIGCRLLSNKQFHKLKYALERDISDWLMETRLKTVQLLWTLLLHLEVN